MQVSIRTSPVERFSARKAKGLNLRAFLSHNTAATALAATDFLPSGLNITVTHYTGTKSTTILDGNLEPYVMESVLGKAGLQYLTLATSPARTRIITLAQTTGVKEQAIIPMYINFGCTIDLKGNDKLEVRLQSLGSEYSSNIDTAVSYVYCDLAEGTEEQWAIPQIVQRTVNGTELTNTFDLGDGVSGIAFINTDKTSLLAAANVIANVVINSEDGFQKNATYDELYSERVAMMPENEHRCMAQSQILLRTANRTLLNRVNMRCTFVSGSVTSGKNFIISRRFVTSPSMVQNYKSSRQARMAKTMSRISNQ